MEKLSKLIFEHTVNGKMDKQVGMALMKQLKLVSGRKQQDIAIIGIGLKVPGASRPDQYWDLIANKMKGIGPFPQNRRQDVEFYKDYINYDLNESMISQGGYLEEIDQFDCDFFKIFPKEANFMNPSQRIFLQTAWQAIEDAGYGGDKLVGSKTGVYAGYIHSNDYNQMITSAFIDSLGISRVGNTSSILASRLSYLLDLKGPTMVIDTACSSSLVAVHTACQAIQQGDCELALAGGIKVNVMPIIDDSYGLALQTQSAELKAFDDRADGTVWGEGSAVVLLKPLENALKDKDHVYAVIKGSASNQDGNSIGITAPNAKAQEDVIVSAWKQAGIDPETIAYIETHGTGTKLGDPIEVTGIQEAFRRYTDKKQFCAISSVKPNIGHLDCAAGVTGLIKAALALKNKQLPPSLNFLKPNANVDFVHSPVYVNDQLVPWEAGETARRCGVSAFGLSGTNCHVILEEAPPQQEMNYTSQQKRLFTLSAKSKPVLEELIRDYQLYVLQHGQARLDEVCYTANTGRGHYAYRLAILADSARELRLKLEKVLKHDLDQPYEAEGIFYGKYKLVSADKQQREAHEITADMRDNLNQEVHAATEAYLADRSDRCLARVAKRYAQGGNVSWQHFYENRSYHKLSLPVYPFEKKRCWLPIEKLGSVVRKPATAQPVQTAQTAQTAQTEVQAPLHPMIDRLRERNGDKEIYTAKLSGEKHWVMGEHVIMGRPAVPGTTYIELTRALVEQRFPNEQMELMNVQYFVPFSVQKGESKEMILTVEKRGEMHMEITASSFQDAATEQLHAKLQVRALTETDQVAPRFSIRDILNRCVEIDTTRLKKESRIIFGPRWTDMIIRRPSFGKGEGIAYLELPDVYKTDMKAYKLHPSLLDIAITSVGQFTNMKFYLPLHYKSIRVYKALQPGLYSYIRLVDGVEDAETFTFDITLMDEHGEAYVDIHHFVMKKVRPGSIGDPPAQQTESPLQAEQGRYFEIAWREQPMPAPAAQPVASASYAHVLVLQPDGDWGEQLAESYEGLGAVVTRVERGDQFARLGERHYRVTGQEADYERLWQELNGSVSHIVDGWAAAEESSVSSLQELQDRKERGVYHLFHLVRSLMKHQPQTNTELVLLARQVHAISGEEEQLHPEYAAMFGLALVAMQEYATLTCRCIDMEAGMSVRDVLPEIQAGLYAGYLISYRNGKRYERYFQPAPLQDKADASLELHEDGAYIITGGTGGIGLEVSKYLARKKKGVRLVLMNRSPLPPREQWASWEAHDKKMIRKLDGIREIEELGAQVVICQVNTAHEAELTKALQHIRETLGPIRGIMHSAGVGAEGILIGKSKEAVENVLAPKMDGTWLLDHLTEQDPVDFFVLFSSLSSITGGIGQGDYCAANQYLDGFAAARNHRGKRTVSINWPAWQEIGMAVDFEMAFDKNLFRAWKTQDAMESLDEVMHKAFRNVIVATFNERYKGNLPKEHLPLHLDEQLAGFYKHTSGAVAQSVPQQASNRDERTFNHAQRHPQETLQDVIAAVWKELLGLEKVDLYESFFDLGGDSIMAMKIVNELNGMLARPMEFSDMMQHDTIHALAQYLIEEGFSLKAEPFAQQSETATASEVADAWGSWVAPGAGDSLQSGDPRDAGYHANPFAYVPDEQEERTTEVARSGSVPDATVTLKGRADGQYAELEVQIARVWSELLGLDAVDVYESFFDLGGDSIMAMKIVNELNTGSSGLTVPIEFSDMMQHDTIHSLATFMRQKEGV
ncbi:SDR family NAD(P)-dependent oxidoreductase [Marinicrinis sediminis]|uniref:SDR family NAD(P)-dependent oxidoreductase n=1 Tax=Marinicrinis sediminis TaxID=1652465 RepID=A0ABW5RAQ4_9BACL